MISIVNGMDIRSSDPYRVRSFGEKENIIDHDHPDGFASSLDDFLAEEGIGRHLHPKDKKVKPTKRTPIIAKARVDPLPRYNSPTNLRECLADVLEIRRIHEMAERPQFTQKRTPFPTETPTSMASESVSTEAPTSTTSESTSELVSTEEPTISDEQVASAARMAPKKHRNKKKTNGGRKRKGRQLEHESMSDVFQSFINVDSHHIDLDSEYDNDFDDDEDEDEDEDEDDDEDEEYDEYDEYDDDDEDYNEFKPVKYYRPPSWLSGYTIEEMNRRLSTCSISLPDLQDEEVSSIRRSHKTQIIRIQGQTQVMYTGLVSRNVE